MTTATTLTGTRAHAPEDVRTIAVVAHPFRSFAEVNRLCTWLRSVPGIVDIRVLGARAGVLHLDVTDTGILPLQLRIEDAIGADCHVVYATDRSIELAFQ